MFPFNPSDSASPAQTKQSKLPQPNPFLLRGIQDRCEICEQMQSSRYRGQKTPSAANREGKVEALVALAATTDLIGDRGVKEHAAERRPFVSAANFSLLMWSFLSRGRGSLLLHGEAGHPQQCDPVPVTQQHDRLWFAAFNSIQEQQSERRVRKIYKGPVTCHTHVCNW